MRVAMTAPRGHARFRLDAFDAHGREMDFDVELEVREVKLIGDVH